MSPINEKDQISPATPAQPSAAKGQQSRVSLDYARWSAPRTAPRLVSFSWGAVSPRSSRR